jgi:filamentous hemagglutinin family protein
MVQVMRILAMFSSGGLLVSTAWATPAVDALPTGGQVVQGAAIISQSGAQMDINQASQRAVINWQTFDVGSNAKVQIIQPNQAAVLLNRVVTNKPSEIYGKIDANGQVILVNNNGIVFGKDGSASASSFTATTLDISDQDFMDGKDRFSSNGSHGEIVNHGTIKAKNGGYVALLGAKVTNNGKIITHNGTVALGAADSIAIPMTSSGKIKMELSAASVNAAVENTKNGVIVTEGGDVYLQAAAANTAMATIKHSGQIDTSGEQAGKAILLADSGENYCRWQYHRK